MKSLHMILMVMWLPLYSSTSFLQITLNCISPSLITSITAAPSTGEYSCHIQHAYLTSNPSLSDSYPQFSIGYWIKINLGNQQWILNEYYEYMRVTAQSDDWKMVMMYINGTTMRFYYTSTEYIAINKALLDKQWYYIYASINYQTNSASISMFADIYDPIYDNDIAYGYANSNNNINNIVYPNALYIDHTLTLYIGGSTYSQFGGHYLAACGKITDFLFIANAYITYGYEYYFRDGYKSTTILLYEFYENAGQIVHDISNNNRLGILGISIDNEAGDPIWSISNQEGLQFIGTSIIIIKPSFLFNTPFTISYWILYKSQQTTCNAIIFQRKLNGSPRFVLYNDPKSQEIHIMTINQDITTGFTIPSGNWNYIAISCNEYNRPALLCYIYVYDPANPNQIQKTKKLFANSKYIESNQDFMAIGDTLCSFIGYLRLFQISRGSSAFIDPARSCDSESKLILGLSTPTNQLVKFTQNLNCVNAGTYNDYMFGRCSKCELRCSQCQNGTNFGCTCADGYKQLTSLSSISPCVCTSSNNYYNIFDGSCSNCNPNCKTCSGPLSTQCISCYPSSYLLENQCVLNCPIRFWANLNTQICSPCDPSCLECNGSLSTQCLACDIDMILDSNICTKACPAILKYYNEATSTCENCHPTCNSCVGSSITDCTSCFANFYLFNGQCLEICPYQYYANEISRQCTICNINCWTCFGANSNQCLSCHQGKYFSKFECLSICPIGTFANTADAIQLQDSSICLKCHPNCNSCNGPYINNCTSCTGLLYFFNGTCDTNCPEAYYSYSSNGSNQCHICPLNCSKCPNGVCSSCLFGYYFISTTKTCNNSCPFGFFPNTATRTCDSCFDTNYCIACNNASPKECTKCLSPTKLLDGVCTNIPTCPTGYYLTNDSSNLHSNFLNKHFTQGTCLPCHKSCLTCISGSSSGCLSCNTPLMLSGTRCTITCPYLSLTIPSLKKCDIIQSCIPHCLSCLNNPANCTICDKGYYLYGSSCVSKCPIKTYPSPNSNLYYGICLPCHSKCETCIGPDSNHCTSCSNINNITSSEIEICHSVNINCPQNMYYDQNLNDCLSCSYNCSTCYSWIQSACLSCKEGYKLILINNITNAGVCILDNSLYSIKFAIDDWLHIITKRGLNNIALRELLIIMILFSLLFSISFYLDIDVRVITRVQAVDYIMNNASKDIRNKQIKMKSSMINIKENNNNNNDNDNDDNADDDNNNNIEEIIEFNLMENDIDESINQKNIQNNPENSLQTNEKANNLHTTYWIDVIKDIKLYHTLIHLFTFQNHFCPSYIRALILLMKIMTQLAFLQIFYLDQIFLVLPEYWTYSNGKYIWSLFGIIPGNIIYYLCIWIIHIPQVDIIKYIYCPNDNWQYIKKNIEIKKIIRYIIFSIFVLGIMIINGFLHLIFYENIREQRYTIWNSVFLMSIVFDLIVFGIISSLFISLMKNNIWMRKFSNMIYLETKIKKMRAYRTITSFKINPDEELEQD